MTISDDEYVARIRRHRPSTLIPLIAQASAHYNAGSWRNSKVSLKFNPWALADAARVSVAYGNEYRTDAVPEDLERILSLYSWLDDRLMWDESDLEALERYMLRTSGEQLTLQESPYDNLARSAAIITQTAAVREPRCMQAGWEQDLFGTGLSTYVGIARLLWAAVVKSGGRFDPTWLEAPDISPIREVISVADFTAVTEAHFVTEVDAFKKENKDRRLASDQMRRRFEYNPLRSRPLLRGYGHGYVAPVADLLWHKGSPLGIYYTGVARHGNAFAQDLGALFEAYVGRQLRLWPDAEVIPEITYGRGNSLSVDWIVVTEELVVLVEVKSVRPTQHLRLATDKRVEELQRMLGRAYTQIDNTAALIARQAKEFTSIPTDRPVQGLIVTMEPFHTVNGPGQRVHLPKTAIPVSVCSAADLEHMVTIDDARLGQLLIDRAADPQRSTYGLRQALSGHSYTSNPILEAGWTSYPWHPSDKRRSP